MAGAINITLSGDRQLLAKLDRLSKKDSRAVVRKAARKAAKPVMQQARANAPVKTGALKKSIKVRAIKRSRTRIGVRISTTGLESVFQGKQFYGAFQEYGWKPGGRKGKIAYETAARVKKDGTLTKRQFRTGKVTDARQGKVEGQHYMQRAAKSKSKEAAAIFADEAAREIKALARK